MSMYAFNPTDLDGLVNDPAAVTSIFEALERLIQHERAEYERARDELNDKLITIEQARPMLVPEVYAATRDGLSGIMRLALGALAFLDHYEAAMELMNAASPVIGKLAAQRKEAES